MIVAGYRPRYSIDALKELSKGFSANGLLKYYAYQNKPLNFVTAYLLGVFTLIPYKNYLQNVFDTEQELAEKQSIALLCALHNKETYKRPGAPEQIAGLCAAIFDYDIGMSPYGFLEAEIDGVMDNCGMGGDLYRTPNISTIAALIAASDGITMCKHGSPGNTDSTGSSDFLESCGVTLFASKELVQIGLEKYHFGYTDALDTSYKSIHVQTHRSAHLAHMNDIIGPITNPLHPRLMTRRVLGVNHLIEPQVVAEAYQLLNEQEITQVDHALFVRGFVDRERNGGIDEVSIFPGGTRVAELKNGKINTYHLHADDFGIPVQEYSEPPQGKDGKAQFSRKILEGKVTGMPKDLVLANTAILYYLTHHLSFDEGFRRAKDVLESGAPVHNLEQYIALTKRETP